MFKKIYQSKRFENVLTLTASIYIVVGLVFATYYAFYYHWTMPFSLLSPGFFAVVLTWPIQAVGFVKDILYFGPAGKPF